MMYLSRMVKNNLLLKTHKGYPQILEDDSLKAAPRKSFFLKKVKFLVCQIKKTF